MLPHLLFDRAKGACRAHQKVGVGACKKSATGAECPGTKNRYLMKYLQQLQLHGSLRNPVSLHVNSENQVPGDAMITVDRELALVAYGADEALIAFWDHEKIGICHAGWRGLAEGLVGAMALDFRGGDCYVSPFIHELPFMHDDCYAYLRRKFGAQYFREVGSGGPVFLFKKALYSQLKGIKHMANDGRDTFKVEALASLRRNPESDRMQHLAIWRTADGNVKHKFFPPGEDFRAYFNVTPAPKLEVELA